MAATFAFSAAAPPPHRRTSPHQGGGPTEKAKVDERPSWPQLLRFPPPPLPHALRPLLRDDISAGNDMPMLALLSWAAKISQGKSSPPAPHPFPCCYVSPNRVGNAVNNESARFCCTLRASGGRAFNQMFLFAAPWCSSSCLLVQLFVRLATLHIGCHDA